VEPDTAQLHAEADAALAAGDAHAAFGRLRRLLEHPGRLDDRADWVATLTLFAPISRALGATEAAGRAGAVADSPDDPVALYELGYELIEQGLPGIAATVLERANELQPGQEQIILELGAALERAGRYARVRSLLRAEPQLLETSFLCRYLLAFGTVMDGDLVEARRLFVDLEPGPDEDSEFMARRIGQFVARADAVAGVTSLDRGDLRGWQYVLTGGLLLHLSPFGFDDGMNGRYAYVQDSEARCLEGLRRLAAVLDARGVDPPQVVALPDPDSQALAEAAGRLLGRDVVALSEQRVDEPGLVVAYDLDGADPELLAPLAWHRPGQVLFGHACCWTRSSPVAADAATYLYQSNVEPWQAHLRMRPDGGGVGRTEPVQGSPAELAARVLGVELEPDALDDLPAPLALARAAGPLPTAGARGRQWGGSPVPSSRFD
jgi:tetratricopeptide (TPR) repeat protein